MKRILAGCGLAACGIGSVNAQSAVSIYGVVDTGLEHVSNVGPSMGSATRVPGLTGLVPSRLGFRGTEDLGGGLRALFTLEGGFGADDGSIGQGGRAFGRQAYVGIGGPWGTLTLGRQYTMNFWALIDADIIGPSAHGLGSIDNYIPNARVDNSLAWRGSFSGVTLGATYSLGRDTVNASSPSGTNCAGETSTDKQACREWSGMVRYDAGTWGAAASYDRMHGGAGAFAGLNRSDLTDTRMQANGYAQLGTVKLGGGLIRRNNEGSAITPKSDLWHAGASWKALPTLAIEAAFHRIRFERSANGANRSTLRAVYSLSKRTSVYASASRISNRGTLNLSVSAGAPGANPPPGGSQTGTMVGLRSTF